MKKQKLSEIMLVLLLIGTLTLAFNIQQVKAVPTDDGGVCTVCIRADGSVDPPTAPIQRDGNIYTLTSNITCDVFSDGIVIETNDMILDGTGYTLQGIGTGSGRGITLSGRSNVTIKNITVKIFSWGISLVLHSSNNSIVGNTITNNGNMGIWLDHSSNNSISGNNITNNNLGIHVCSSLNNSIYHNNFIDNTQQVDVTTPSYTNFWDDGYPSGGNYWSDYNGIDLCKGVYQSGDGSDGIGDTPYVIDGNNRDSYPLMKPDPPGSMETSTDNPVPVGGVCIPVNKLDLLTPYIVLASTVLAATAAVAIYLSKERRTESRES